MGQYYLVANIDKKEYMISPDFVKLMEWSYNYNDLILEMENHMAMDWKGDHIYVIGDYAGSGADCRYTELLKEIEDKLNIDTERDSIFDRVFSEFKKLPVREGLKKYRYIVNHAAKEYIDNDHCPYKENMGNWEENGKILSATIAPLSLMLALGNGQGGGDYYAHNHELVGSWAKDSSSLEITDVKPKSDYKELQPEFHEGKYIPYKKRPDIISKLKNRESRQR